MTHTSLARMDRVMRSVHLYSSLFLVPWMLEKAGVEFGEGASAVFNPGNSQLIVRNTESQLKLVEKFAGVSEPGKEKTETAPAPADGSGPGTIEAKLKAIVIPKADFVDTPFDVALEFLQQRSMELDQDPDPARRGINFIVEKLPNDDPPLISLKLTNVPLREALRYTVELADCEYTAEEHAVVISPKKP